jgi:hypothetical protein
MGVWKRTHWIMAEVHRIDRVQGKVEVVLKQQHRSYTEAQPTDIIKGIDLCVAALRLPLLHTRTPSVRAVLFAALCSIHAHHQ